MKSRLVIAATTALVLTLLLVTVPAHSGAQQGSTVTPKPKDDSAQGLNDLVVREVLLPVTVTDDRDRSILELTQDDFEVYEDGQRQRITSFEAQSSRPVDVAILMDVSNSVRPKLKYEREAASNFIQTILRGRRDRVLFSTFNDKVELRQDFTDNSELLHKAIADKTLKAFGETRLFDAIYRICEEKLDNTRNPDRRGIIIVISDGEDTASERSLKDTIALAQTKGVPIFGISTKAGGFFGVQAGMVMNAEDKELGRLSEETGGQIFFPGDVLALERTFRLINDLVRTQYLLTYAPENQNWDSKFRQVEVKLNRSRNSRFKDFNVKTRTGYLAVPLPRAGTILN